MRDQNSLVSEKISEEETDSDNIKKNRYEESIHSPFDNQTTTPRGLFKDVYSESNFDSSQIESSPMRPRLDVTQEENSSTDSISEHGGSSEKSNNNDLYKSKARPLEEKGIFSKQSDDSEEN